MSGSSKSTLEALKRLRRSVHGDWTIQDVLVQIDALPEERGRVVRHRLEILEPVITGDGPRPAVADLLARLGTGRRNLYVLIDRLRRLSPLEALSPPGGSRTAVRTLSTQDGDRIAVIDRVVAEMKLADPGVRLASVVRAARTASIASGHAPPAAKTVSRRMDTYRPSCRPPLAERLLLDACPVNMAVRHGERLVPQSLALLLDAQSAEILGWGASWVGDDASAMLGAMVCMRRWAAETRRRRSMSEDLLRFDVVLPPGTVVDTSGEIDPRLRLNRGGPRSSGVRMKRLAGEKLGSLVLQPRGDRSRMTVEAKESSDWIIIDRKALPIVLDQVMKGFGPGVVDVPVDVREVPDALDQATAAFAPLLPAIERASLLATGRPIPPR